MENSLFEMFVFRCQTLPRKIVRRGTLVRILAPDVNKHKSGDTYPHIRSESPEPLAGSSSQQNVGESACGRRPEIGNCSFCL